jgi:ketosteroid isomerase-like protein
MAEGDRAELAKLLKAWSAAIVANDATAIDAFVEPEWALVGQTGLFSREQFLASVAAGELTHETMSHDVHRVHNYGDVAVVVTRVVNNGSFGGRAFESDEWSTDVFVRRDRRWRCVLTHLTPVIEPSAS